MWPVFFVAVGTLAAAAAIIVLLARVLDVEFLVTHSHGGTKAKSPSAKPLEFLYLDINRVGAYLAQLDGGTDIKERIGEKEIHKANGEVAFENAFKAGTSVENENFVEREVTPTVASSFVRLRGKLSNELKRPFLEELKDEIASSEPESENGSEEAPVKEGDFVQFKTEVQMPTYLNLYMTVHHEATMEALYPTLGNSRFQRKAAQKQRRAAREFEQHVGRDPRIMLSVKAEKGVKILLPTRLRQLNEERSLLSPGSEFTIIGKLVRIFRPGDAPYPKASYAYVDSLTRARWKQPLVQAPKGLICRATPKCMTAVEELRKASRTRHKKFAARVHGRIEHFRQRLLYKLKNSTEISRAGAVILPIAIYR